MKSGIVEKENNESTPSKKEKKNLNPRKTKKTKKKKLLPPSPAASAHGTCCLDYQPQLHTQHCTQRHIRLGTRVVATIRQVARDR